MKLKAFGFVVVLGLLIRPLTAPAEATGVEQFNKFMTGDFHKGLISRALSNLPPTVFQRCPTLAGDRSRITVLQPPTFAPDGFPNAGAWKESFPISGCGNDTILNFFFVAGSDEKVNTIIGIPGTTIGSPALQQDARTFATLALTPVAKDCRNFDVKNSRFEGYGLTDPPTVDPGPNSRFRPWWETWTLVGCGRTFEVSIDFTPNEKGTHIVTLPARAIDH